MPRRLRFPDLPPGPHQELLVFLHELHRLAGEPSTREIAEGILKASDGEIRCSHTTIHALLAGRKLPTKGDLLFELVKFLHGRNRHQRKSEDTILDELDALWGPATRRHLLAVPTLPLPASPQRPPAGGSTYPQAATPSRPGTVSSPSADPPNFPATDPAPGMPHHDGAATSGNDVTNAISGGRGVGPVIQARDIRGDLHIGGLPPARRTRVLNGLDEARPPALPELQTSRAVLAGVSHYQDGELPGLPGIQAGVSQLSDLLQRPPGAFLEENIIRLLDPSALNLFEGVQHAAEGASDTLLVYYSGHGLVSSRRGDLLLATPDTRLGRDYTAASYDTIRDLISNSRARRSIVILDCCFSGRALEAMGPLGSLAEIPAAYVITSTSRNRAAFAPTGSQYTQFTGALIKILQEGISGAGELLTIRDICEQLRVTSIEQGFPAPEWRVHNDQGLALTRNPAYAPLPSPPKPPQQIRTSIAQEAHDAGYPPTRP
jgi:Caspase domain